MTGRPLSFRTRLTLRWTAAFGLLLACANTAVYMGVRAFAEHDLDANLRTLAATEIASSTDAGGTLHLHELPPEELGGGEFAGKFVQYYRLDGTVVFESTVLHGDRVLDAAHFARARRDDHGIATVQVGERRGRVVTAHIRDTTTPYIAAVGLFTDSLDALLARLAWILTGVWTVGLGATALIGFLLASRALEPVDEITARAARIATGDIDMRLDPPRTDDEIGRMTRLLNEMLDRLHRVIDGNRRFAADASHELRSPLTAMAGEIDVTLRRDRTPDEYRETLQRLRTQIDGLTSISEQLMLLVRAEERPGNIAAEEVPVAASVQAACARLAPQAAARGIRVTHGGLDHLVAYVQPVLLARILDNMIANAVLYNREGGSVHITGCDEPAPGDAWEAGRLRLEVTDSGPGIPRDEWERVFDRFYRREPSRSRRTGGAGLGLALSRAIATWLGGTLRVRASGPDGSTFELTVPGSDTTRSQDRRSTVGDV
ncbi:ATP-binding protein [Luteitalea sp.]|uniref:sensor histidine kinase n=1 Tax=Luteitalea sp. TaxID=2004800 RepID=UPI0025BF3ACB|nr:ATP-binding protein [Luteitalea sp.]